MSLARTHPFQARLTSLVEVRILETRLTLNWRFVGQDPITFGGDIYVKDKSWYCDAAPKKWSGNSS